MKDDNKKDPFEKNEKIPLDFDKKIKLSEGEKKKIKRIRKLSRLVDYFILFISLLALFIGFYAFWDTHKVMRLADSDIYEVYKPDSRDSLTFEDLKNKNSDLVAWLNVYGTNIDYPVVKGKDNDEYLNKTVLGDFSIGGSIFLDASNTSDFSDFQNVIYGHFMAERKMFGDLDLFEKKEFFDSHKYGLLHRLGKKTKGIEFFAFLKSFGDDRKILNTAKTIEASPDLIDYIYKNSKYTRKIDFTDNENLVILDTCDFSKTNGRSILIGRLTDDIKENIYKEDIKENQFAKLISNIYKINLLIILVIIWVILVIIYLIYQIIKLKKERKER